MQQFRHIEKTLKTHFQTYKQAIVLLGARQTGKTTLLKKVFPNATYLLLDNEQVKQTLESYDISTYKQILGTTQQLIIDELHLVSDPGRVVKIIYDQLPNIQLIVTGSSALHIKNKSTESMAGRKIEYQLFPLTFSEYLVQKGISQIPDFTIFKNSIQQQTPTKQLFSAEEIVQHLLLYGLYPETLNIHNSRLYLDNLAESAVFKDIVELNLIDNRVKAKELLKLLAYQIGNLINYSEIGSRLSLDRRTVEKYINIFEQSFLVFRVYPYSKKGRDEIGKTPKIYFHDVGLRNALIRNFELSHLRTDYGALFENFIIAELKKSISYQQLDYKLNYWRIKSGSEVDVVLSNNSELHGIEIKVSSGQISEAFVNRYPQAQTKVLTFKNFF
jgi:uncharacterized protein